MTVWWYSKTNPEVSLLEPQLSGFREDIICVFVLLDSSNRFHLFAYYYCTKNRLNDVCLANRFLLRCLLFDQVISSSINTFAIFAPLRSLRETKATPGRKQKPHPRQANHTVSIPRTRQLPQTAQIILSLLITILRFALLIGIICPFMYSMFSRTSEILFILMI